MKNIFKLASLLAASAFLALASSGASAGIINFSFTNTGSSLAGLGMVGFMAWRRRRATTQI